MSSCISECGESASVTNASISTDPKNTSVTQNMDEVSKRKRHYSFDDLDNEPEEKPKLRKFSSLNFRKSTSAGATVGPCESIRECPYNERTNTEEVKTGGMHAAFIKSNSQTSEQSDKTAETSSVDSTHSADVVDSYAEIAGQQKCSDLRSTASQRILYVHNQELIDHCNKLPRIPERAGMVHSLIEALGLLEFMDVVPPRPAEEEEVTQFHSKDYIEFLQRINQQDDEEKIDPADAEQYGLTYDCPVQEGVYDCAALVAGATVTAAQALCDKQCRAAINWCGGWHHAQRSEASGFCYINDIVLGILILRKTFSRILYVDLDLHHGDGVENAFSTTPHVLTVSFHKFDAGFFPGSGSVHEVGSRGGKYYSVNVPMKDGVCDAQFLAVFRRVMNCVRETYNPEVVVCQCGADGLAGDPMSSFNLTLAAYRHCLYFLMMWKLPLLLLGGGGYHHANTARCWASLTALMVSRKLPQDVPDHKYFTDYGPDYELTVEAGNRKNHNSSQDLASICTLVSENLQNIKGKQL